MCAISLKRSRSVMERKPDGRIQCGQGAKTRPQRTGSSATVLCHGRNISLEREFAETKTRGLQLLRSAVRSPTEMSVNSSWGLRAGAGEPRLDLLQSRREMEINGDLRSFDLASESRTGKNKTRSRSPKDRENRDSESAIRSRSPTLAN